jgi:hypothetical protein
VREVQGTILEA